MSKQCSAEGLILDFLFPVLLALPLCWSGLRSVVNDLNNVETPGTGVIPSEERRAGEEFYNIQRKLEVA